MDCKKWAEKYEIDCRLKYNSRATQDNYISQVKSFLYHFEKAFREPKEIPTEEIKKWLLEKESPNTRNHRLCSIKSFYELTVRMPVKLDKIPFSQKEKKLPIVLMAYSSIKRKKCKCSDNCNKFPTLGYGGYFSLHAPKEILDKVGTKKQVAKRNKNARNKVSNLLHKDSEADKTKLLAMADKLFGDYIKTRDIDKGGNIVCPCCKLSYNIYDKTNDGSGYIVQPLHFVSRSVYRLRFDERQVYAGCCYCNLKMHLHPEGEAVKNYQDMLVDKLGIVEVMRMVAQKRTVNKLSVEDLKEVIQKYKK